MKSCQVCSDGTMQFRNVDEVFKRDDGWIAITGIPALVCDQCGETTYPVLSAERIQNIISGQESPTDFIYLKEYSFVPSQVVSLPNSTSLENSDNLKTTEITGPNVISGNVNTHVDTYGS